MDFRTNGKDSFAKVKFYELIKPEMGGTVLGRNKEITFTIKVSFITLKSPDSTKALNRLNP